MGFEALISGLIGNILSGLFGKIKGKKFEKDIEKAFSKTLGKSEYSDILGRLSFNKNFTETIWEIGKGLTIDCNKLVELSLKISATDNLKLSRPQIIIALKTFSLDLLNVFAAKNAELGKIPSGIHNFYNSMELLSLMPDCLQELLKEKIKDAGNADLEATLRQFDKIYEFIAKQDKEIQKKIDAGEFGEAEKLLLQSFDKNLQYKKKAEEDALQHTEKAAGNAFLLAKLKELQLEYKEAKKYYEEAVRLSPNNSLYLNALGYILHDLGKYDEAIKYFQNALNIDLKAFGDNHPNIATRYNNIGAVSRELGKYNKAIDYYQKAISIALKTFGDNHPNIATTYNNIGTVLTTLNKYDEAIKCYQKALNIDLKIFGDNHPNIAATYNNIGAALQKSGEHKKAIKYFQKAEKIDLKTFGNNHPNIAATYNNLSNAYYSLRDYKKAIEYLQKAEKICMQFLGADHPNTKKVKQGIKIVKQALMRK